MNLSSGQKHHLKVYIENWQQASNKNYHPVFCKQCKLSLTRGKMRPFQMSVMFAVQVKTRSTSFPYPGSCPMCILPNWTLLAQLITFEHIQSFLHVSSWTHYSRGFKTKTNCILTKKQILCYAVVNRVKNLVGLFFFFLVDVIHANLGNTDSSLVI